jgi:cytochrome c-type biogenesis protein CcmH/NrfF
MRQSPQSDRDQRAEQTSAAARCSVVANNSLRSASVNICQAVRSGFSGVVKQPK